jgi:beta-lactamase regulating signal transducer with metallopeptidase domain/regulator of replication initiation timing
MILAAVQAPVPTWIFDLSPKILRHLIDPAARSLAIASLTGLVMVLAQVRNLSLRLSVWKAVIGVALAMPVLAICLPPLPVSVPVPEMIPGFSESTAKTETSMSVFVMQAPTRASVIVSPAPRRANIVDAGRAKDRIKPFASFSRSVDVPRSTLALGVYSAGALFLAFRFLLGWFLSYKLRQASRAIHDLELVRRFRCRCDAAQLRALPQLAESDRLSVPLTCGVMRPFVLLPADWRAWDAEKLDAVLAHEISHLARRDALTERLALLHRSIFWFSPLAWWLPRCLADLAEEASDEAALATGTEPTKYAEILLGFLEDLNSVSCRAHWQGLAMAQAGSAEKRLDRILNGRGIMSMQAKKSVVAVLVLGSLPVVLVAAALQPHRLGSQIVFSRYTSRIIVPPGSTGQLSATVSPVPVVAGIPASRAFPVTVPGVAPVATDSAVPAVSAIPNARAIPAASAAVAPVTEVSATPDVSVVPEPRAIPVVAALARIAAVSEISSRVVLTAKSGVQAQAPATTVPPAPPVSGSSPPPVPPVPSAAAPAPAPPYRSSYAYSYSNSHLADRGDSYAIVTAKTQTMNGSFSHMDFAELEALRRKINGDFLWFERDGKSYVITDPETVKRATEAFATQSELGRQQGELGERQGTLGEAQGALGEQQGVLGEQLGELSSNLENMKIRIPDMTAELKALNLKTQELSRVFSQKDVDEMHVNMEQMQKEIAEATKSLNQAHSVDAAALEAAMSQARAAIDEQMAKFSAEQSKLGEQQARLSKEQAELGRQQAKAAAKAEAEIKTIIDQALSRGTAQPAPKQ